MKYTYPACKTIDKVEDWFGTQLPDPYAWLRDKNDPEVLDFVARENAYTDQWFDDSEIAAMTAKLKAQALPDPFYSLSLWKDGYIAVRNKSGDFELELLDKDLNVVGTPAIPAALKNVSIFSLDPRSKDDKLMHFVYMYPGFARPTVAVCDMEAGTVLVEVNDVFSSCWSKGDGCLYYSSTVSDPVKQTARSTFYRFDPITGETKTVYEDDRYCIFGQVHPSIDGSYVMAMICQDYSLAGWVAINTATGEASLLTQTAVEWEYIDSQDGKHYFITKTDAPHGAVIAVANSGSATVVLPEFDNIFLESGFSAGGKLFALGRENVNSRLIDVASGKSMDLPSLFGSLDKVAQLDGDMLLKFESFLDAPCLMRFDGQTMTVVQKSSDAIYPELVVEQHFAPSTVDKKPIPYYLVRRKDAKADGSSPAMAYAYGGYNLSMPPSFVEMVTQLNIPQWVQDGGIFIQINNRGGSEYGPAWHEDGMMMNKRHCYEDFIGCVEHAIASGWTSAGKVGICGCSNGGLLMSALVTMRPDLWGCVIDSVPHTDMIHFVEDDRGPMYITEYGNPRESEEMFRYLLSYSPYHNVQKTNYPPVYVQTGEMDNNVPPYHGKKFAARMQAENQSDNPILLRVLAEGSHDRGKGDVFWKTISEMQLFIQKALKET